MSPNPKKCISCGKTGTKLAVVSDPFVNRIYGLCGLCLNKSFAKKK